MDLLARIKRKCLNDESSFAAEGSHEHQNKRNKFVCKGNQE